jgi:hypothetical protein
MRSRRAGALIAEEGTGEGGDHRRKCAQQRGPGRHEQPSAPSTPAHRQRRISASATKPKYVGTRPKRTDPALL